MSRLGSGLWRPRAADHPQCALVMAPTPPGNDAVHANHTVADLPDHAAEELITASSCCSCQRARRFPPHDAKSMDRRWPRASDQWSCRRGIPGNPHVGRGLNHDGSTIQMNCAARSSRGEAAMLTPVGAGTCPTSSGSPGLVARVERSGCLPPRRGASDRVGCQADGTSGSVRSRVGRRNHNAR